MGILEHVTSSQAMVLSNTGSYINMNTLFGVVVVLAVLLLVAIVYLVNIMSYLKNDPANKAVSDNHASDTGIGNTGSVVTEQANLVDDRELVAVITAAIYASMGTDAPADGLVVRSIRRVR